MVDGMLRLVIFFFLCLQARKFMYFDGLNEFISIFVECFYILYTLDLQHLIYLFHNIHGKWMKVNNITKGSIVNVFLKYLFHVVSYIRNTVG